MAFDITDFVKRSKAETTRIDHKMAAGGSSLPHRVETDDPTAIADTTATLQGRLEALGTATEAEVFFHYRETGGGTWTETTRDTQAAPGEFDVELTGLTAGTEYACRAVAVTPAGDLAMGATVIFETTDDGTTQPSVATQQPTGLADTTADLQGELTALGSYSDVDVFFQYRPAAGLAGWQAGSWSSTTPTTQAATGTFSTTVGGLTPGTSYLVRAVAETPAGIVPGAVLQFETTTSTSTQLDVTTGGASAIGPTSVDLSGTLNSLGTAQSAGCYFQIRTTGSDVWHDTDGTFLTVAQGFSVEATELEPDTEYEFRAAADNGTTKATGGTQTVTTDSLAMDVATVGHDKVTASTAELTGDVLDLGNWSKLTALFQYREGGLQAWQRSETTSVSSPGEYSLKVDDLDPETVMEYRAVIEAGGASVAGGTQSFTTGDGGGGTPGSGSIDDFEDGADAGWTDPHGYFSVVSTNVINGTQSGHVNKTDGAANQPMARYDWPSSFPSNPTTLEWYHSESSDSTGGGVTIRDASDDIIAGLVTNNPTLHYYDSGGWHEDQGLEPDYGDIVRVTVTFDWASGSISYETENVETGETITRDDNMGSTNAIDSIRLDNYNSFRLSSEDSECIMWFDDFSYED